MKRWSVTLNAEGYYDTEIEAETYEEAVDLAINEANDSCAEYEWSGYADPIDEEDE